MSNIIWVEAGPNLEVARVNGRSASLYFWGGAWNLSLRKSDRAFKTWHLAGDIEKARNSGNRWLMGKSNYLPEGSLRGVA